MGLLGQHRLCENNDNKAVKLDASILVAVASDQVAGKVVALGAVRALGRGGVAAAAEGDNDGGLLGGLGLDVVGQVVGVVAGEGLAARGRGLGLGRVHHVDTVVVSGVDDGRDIEVGQAVPALEVDLGEHAGDVVAAAGDSVGVANEAVAKSDIDGGTAGNGDGVDTLDTGAGGDVDGTLSVVGRDEAKDVVSLDGGSQAKGSDSAERNHFECGRGCFEKVQDKSDDVF